MAHIPNKNSNIHTKKLLLLLLCYIHCIIDPLVNDLSLLSVNHNLVEAECDVINTSADKQNNTNFHESVCYSYS